LIFILLIIVATAGTIWWLHRSERQQRLHNVDLQAPLPAVDPQQLSLEDTWSLNSATEPLRDAAPVTPTEAELVPSLFPDEAVAVSGGAPKEAALTFEPATPSSGSDHWQDQLKALRDAGALDAALTLARTHFPRTHALQQAAVILRQQVRLGIERTQNVDHWVSELYDTALVAALARGKRVPSLSKLGTNSEDRYRVIGYEHLKLLTKNDIRQLRQLWGEPERHQNLEPHSES